MFFDNWSGQGRATLIGVLAYVGLIVLLRLSGKRTLSKMNAFDLVVTVAFGSTLATALLSKDVPLAEGLTGLAILIFLQLIVTWLSVRSGIVRRLVRSEPTLLYFRGAFLHQALRAERVLESEAYQAVRSNGRGGLESVKAVVLESDGSLSVVSSATEANAALRGVGRAASNGVSQRSLAEIGR